MGKRILNKKERVILKQTGDVIYGIALLNAMKLAHSTVKTK